jgi:hypothetical protein
MDAKHQFLTRAAFNTALAAGEVTEDSLCFIRDTREIYAKGDMYRAGGMFFQGDFSTEHGTYYVGDCVRFASHLFICTTETTNAPYPVYTDTAGKRITYKDGSYVVADLTVDTCWAVVF